MFHFIKRTASSIANASAGKVRLWADTDGTFKVKDDAGVVKTLGNGIASIAQTGTNGLNKTYRITRDDGSVFDYTVRDGADGLIQSVNGKSAASITLSAGDVGADPAGTASSVIANHVAAADPHSQYTTTAEAAAAAPVQSVNGQTGAVTIAIPPSTNNKAVTNTARSAAFSTAVTTVASLPITGGSVQPGDTYFFRIRAQVTNTTTATNLVATIAVGATAVITITQALGTTARTNQPVTIEGYLLFLSATSAEADVRAFASAAVAFDAIAATAASVAVSTAADTDVNMKVNTSGATSTVTLVQALIIKEK